MLFWAIYVMLSQCRKCFIYEVEHLYVDRDMCTRGGFYNIRRNLIVRNCKR